MQTVFSVTILLLFYAAAVSQPRPSAGPSAASATSHPSAATAPPHPSAAAAPAGAVIRTGAEQIDLYLPLLQGQSVAVFANPTSIVGKSHLVDTLLKKGIRIQKIFSPEHGFRGVADAGATVGNQTDPATGIPVISLYGSKLKPFAADLADVDVLLFDIQDVGVRFYTYISSLQKYLESAIENNRPLIILDRPDPNGFYVDGPVLDPKFRSFVGMQPIPVVYGMTIGEYARMLIGEQWLDPAADSTLKQQASNPTPQQPANTRGTHFRLTVIPCLNYTHQSRYALPVKPSPNLPDMQSVYLYPSLCLFEGTPVSLGRGTSKPFQQFGHPSFPTGEYSFTPESMPGASKPPQMGQVCYGEDLSQVDVAKATGGQWSLQWLLKAYGLFTDKDHFFTGNGSGFDRLAGSDLLRHQIRDGLTEEQIRQTWEPALSNFKMIRKKYLLYAD